jgi:hypothetical protein
MFYQAVCSMSFVGSIIQGEREKSVSISVKAYSKFKPVEFLAQAGRFLPRDG